MNTYLLSVIHLDRETTIPLYRQIYGGLRTAILERQLSPGTRLPSSRDLAGILDVSRNTVLNAVDQLRAEGYLEARAGAGTFVTTHLPEDMMRPQCKATPTKTPLIAERRLSAIGERYQTLAPNFHTEATFPHRDHLFTIGVPDLHAFPFDHWAQLTARNYRTLPLGQFGYGNSAMGYHPLREAVADYLRASRAVRCDADQVIITSGAQQAITLAVRLLLNPGDQAWVEDPGYRGVMATLFSQGAVQVHVPVDAEGLDVGAGIDRAPNARLVYITPSHQFPTGYTLSLERRLALLQWAARAGAWIIEDDYDSEYRYQGHPLASLQGLDTAGRVIYVGTFSKVLFPALRIGYVVLPSDLVGAFAAAHWMIGPHPPLVTQAVLTEFIREGHFSRHIRRMRKLYAQKRDVLVTELKRQLGNRLRLGPTDTGLHVMGWLPPDVDDLQVERGVAAHHIAITRLSTLCSQSNPQSGLVLGYAGATLAAIPNGVRHLAEMVETLHRR